MKTLKQKLQDKSAEITNLRQSNNNSNLQMNNNNVSVPVSNAMRRVC